MTDDDRCPDENAFSRLLGGELPEATRLALEAHVDRCAACSALLRELGRVVASAPATEAETPARDGDAEPAQRYAVLRPIGSGGAGRVYEAVDHLLGRRVALKFLHPRDEGAALPEGRAKILAEARALARLSHPNVVSVFDVGVDGGAVFLAMELVDGDPLGAWLRGAPRSFEERLRVGREIGAALAAAHRAGLVHRDVKPANVVVGRDGHARLTDFGLACETDGASAGHAGTPLYMAPELFAGGAASASTDQYAFGLVLYECLYGVHPYAGATLEAVRSAQARGVAREPPRSDAPPVLHALVARAASPSPEARYRSIDELFAVIDHALDVDVTQRLRSVAIAQVVMSVLYVCLTAFVVFALFTDFGAPEPDVPDDPLSPALEGLGVALALVTLSGWAPIAAIWGAVNAWALFRGKRWARGSSIGYAVLSICSCVGAPVGVYALVALIARRRPRASP